MKNRDYKNFTENQFYHIFNRGVNKSDIFKDEQDYLIFLSRLKENLFPQLIDKKKASWLEKRRKTLPPDSFDLICYCLMPNHFHLLIQQKTDLSITKLMSKLCTSYSMCFNKKYKRVGGVFQDQFKAVLVEDNEQLLWTSYYIHKNPFEADLVEQLRDYKWSSYSEYFDSKPLSRMCDREIIAGQFNSEDKYLEYFENREKDAETSLQNLYFDFDED